MKCLRNYDMDKFTLLSWDVDPYVYHSYYVTLLPHSPSSLLFSLFCCILAFVTISHFFGWNSCVSKLVCLKKSCLFASLLLWDIEGRPGICHRRTDNVIVNYTSLGVKWRSEHTLFLVKKILVIARFTSF